MLIGFLTGLFLFVAFLLAFFVLLQHGKSSLGFTGLGGGAQMLFGGSGGQEIFQKITWGFLLFFMLGSLSIATLKSRYTSRTHNAQPSMPISQDYQE